MNIVKYTTEDYNLQVTNEVITNSTFKHGVISIAQLKSKGDK